MHADSNNSQTRLILFNKPYGVLSQFTDDENRPTLRDYIREKQVYPAGRLDRDSEGLLLLTDNGRLQQKIAHPGKKTWKTYLVQVEGMPDQNAVEQLRAGVSLKDGLTRPAKVKIIQQPGWLWPRDPPVRFRKTVPDHWLEIKIREGKNRQVRRMTAAVGLPTLRLVRVQVGEWKLNQLKPGEYFTQYLDIENGESDALDTTHHRRSSHKKRRPVSHGKGKKR